MTEEQFILDMDDTSEEARCALLDEAIARGYIRMVVKDGVATACLMPGFLRPTPKRRPPLDPDVVRALLEDAFARIIAALPDND